MRTTNWLKWLCWKKIIAVVHLCVRLICMFGLIHEGHFRVYDVARRRSLQILVRYFLPPLLLEPVCHLGEVDVGLGTAAWLLDLHLEICLSFSE